MDHISGDPGRGARRARLGVLVRHVPLARLDPAQQTSDFSGPYDQVGTTYVSTMKMMGFEMEAANKVVEVEPLKLIHEHTDDKGSMDTYFRLAPEGDATRPIVESDYEMPGHIPGVLKSFMTRSFFERQMRHMLGDFKTFAEATVPVPV